DARVLAIRKKLAPLLPHCSQPRNRGREEMNAQFFLVQYDVELARARTDAFDTCLQAREPFLRVQPPEEIGRWTGDEFIALRRVVEQPAGCEDVAADDERHRGIEHL